MAKPILRSLRMDSSADAPPIAEMLIATTAVPDSSFLKPRMGFSFPNPAITRSVLFIPSLFIVVAVIVAEPEGLVAVPPSVEFPPGIALGVARAFVASAGVDRTSAVGPHADRIRL